MLSDISGYPGHSNGLPPVPGSKAGSGRTPAAITPPCQGAQGPFGGMNGAFLPQPPNAAQTSAQLSNGQVNTVRTSSFAAALRKLAKQAIDPTGK